MKLLSSWFEYGFLFIMFAGFDYLFTGGQTVWTAWDIFQGGVTLIIFSLIGYCLLIIFRGKQNDAA